MNGNQSVPMGFVIGRFSDSDWKIADSGWGINVDESTGVLELVHSFHSSESQALSLMYVLNKHSTNML